MNRYGIVIQTLLHRNNLTVMHGGQRPVEAFQSVIVTGREPNVKLSIKTRFILDIFGNRKQVLDFQV